MSANRLALGLLVSGAVAIAFAPIFVRLSELGPIATAFYRTALAWLPLWLWYRHSEASSPAEVVSFDWRLCLPGVFFALDLATWHWSIQLTSVANATLLPNLAPVFVALGGFLLFRERVTAAFLTGLATVLTGLILLSGASLQLGKTALIGDGLGVLTALFYGAYILTVSRLRRRYTTLHIMHWSTLVATITLLPLAWLSGDQLGVQTLRGLAVLLGLAWIAQVAGQGLIAHALAHLPAAYSSLVLIIQPMCAAGLAWLWFDERLSVLQLFGAAIILCGIVLASLSQDGAKTP